MDAADDDNAAAKPTTRSNKSYQRQKAAKSAKIEKKRVRKPRNTIVFPKHPKKMKTGSKR